MASTIVYGICHDQVTARVCIEYFTVGHTPVLQTDSPTLLALAFGTMATWWVGLILGVLAALASRSGSWPKVDAAHLIRPIACLLVVVAVASLLAGLTGYRLARSSGFVLPDPLGSRISQARHALFLANTLAHLAAYAVGLLGGLAICARVLVQRRRAARAAPLNENGTARFDLLAEQWIVVVSRWIARTIGIPLFVLLLLLTFSDGPPSPLTTSPREILFGVVVLIMLVGLFVAWKWEGVGSLLILGGLALFATANEPFLLKIVFIPWLVTGSLYLACWIGKRRGSRAPGNTLSDPNAAIGEGRQQMVRVKPEAIVDEVARRLETDLNAVRSAIASGQRENAEEMLAGIALNTTPAGQFSREIGDLYGELGFPAMAGRYWYLLDDKSDEMLAACKEFERSLGNNPVLIIEACGYPGALPHAKEMSKGVDELHEKATEFDRKYRYDVRLRTGWRDRIAGLGCAVVACVLIYIFVAGIVSIIEAF
jgi:hypothetical protein